MTGQILDRVLTCYRIGDPEGRYPIFDATGSTGVAARWNSTSCPMIYTSEHYSTAMLEKLVHGSGKIPPNQHFIKITIPTGVPVDVLNTAHLPDWYLPSHASSRPFGDDWQKSRRSLILAVPSVVAREERNFLINPQHPDFPKITHELPVPVWWDERLFRP